jgi:hypothetical protein
MKNLKLILLALILTACNLPSYPKPPIPEYTVSENDAVSAETTVETAVNEISQTGRLNVTLTQEQVSSWLALRAPGYASQYGYTWPLKDVQAALNDGKLMIYGIVVQQNVPETAAQIVVVPQIDANGKLVVKVEGGQFGLAGLPADVTQQFNTTIQEMLGQLTAEFGANYRLESLVIANGTLTVTGQVTQ